MGRFRFIEVPSGNYRYCSGKNRREAYNKLKRKLRKMKRIKYRM